MCISRKHCLAILTALYFGFSSQVYADPISHIYTSNEPLLSQQSEDGQVKGLFTDFFLQVAERANRQVNIKRLPWKRAQQIAESDPNIAIGPLTRTARREDKFKWVGSLFPMRIVYLTLGDQPTIDSLEQARKLTIAIKGGSAAMFASRKHELPEANLTVVHQQELIFRMLQNKRVEGWLVWDVIAYRTIKEIAPNVELETGLVDNLGDLYLAASPSTSEEELAIWQKALLEVRNEGAFDKIMHKYLGKRISKAD